MKISGKWLKHFREESFLTRNELAEVAGVSHQRIWQMETDETSNINPVIGRLIAKKLKVTINDLKGE